MTITEDIFNGKTTKRKELERIRVELEGLHEVFSSAEDSQHTLLDVAIYAIDQIIEDHMYGGIDR
jgi:hypothetical protein